MAILGEKERKFLRSKFSKALRDGVRLLVFTQEFECEYCAELRKLAQEIAEIDERIKTEVYDFQSDKELAEKLGVDKIPALLVFGEREYGVRFFGIPSGYEFTTLVEDIIDVSKGLSRLPEQVKEKVRKINRQVHIQVFVTPTCPYCPIVVRTAHQLAIENEKIISDMVEALEFPHLASRYQVMAVPKIVINDKISFEGAVPEHVFVDYVLAAIKS
ncbi:MAG: thioredoxin family protein [Thaumarchaeota archaeon]|nr:thioredoxin family protein [Nitrososphaerota archaeon]